MYGYDNFERQIILLCTVAWSVTCLICIEIHVLAVIKHMGHISFPKAFQKLTDQFLIYMYMNITYCFQSRRDTSIKAKCPI